MNCENGSEDNTHEDTKSLQALPRFLLLKVQHRVSSRTEVPIDDLRHQFADLQKLVAVKPVG